MSNFTVTEGMSRILVHDFLHINSRHFDDLEIMLVVTSQPRHGSLESSRESGVPLQKFSLNIAMAEFVYYLHDGSDTTQVHLENKKL